MVTADLNVLHKNPAELGNQPEKEAIVLVILNKKGQILLGQEKAGDPTTGRKPGQYNLVTETIETEKGEGRIPTIYAAIKEELSNSSKLFTELLMNLRLVRETVYVANFGLAKEKPSRATLMVLRYLGDPEGKPPFQPGDTQEIETHQWTDFREIASLREKDQLAPSVYEYLDRLQTEGWICPYQEGEPHIELPFRDYEKIRNS